MRILVCNDDGITAKGLRALVEVAQEFGEVMVVAPDRPQSGMGHAISIGVPLRLYPSSAFGPDIPAWACSGTPADCVKLATGVLGLDPELLLCGINHGANFSISVFYSGTLSAAIEGAFEGIPSIGFSLLNYSMEADFSAAQAIVREVILLYLAQPFPAHVPLNVNIPNLPLSEIKGIRLTRQAQGRFIEQFEQRIDPYGQPYYWMVGRFESSDTGSDTDLWALEKGYVSICPLLTDLTNHHFLHHWEVIQR
ncbi:MAG: 5'/3'-nucleotidase SurE [Bacteroidia bacterium]|nr:5'/3'-nucleotidase SurE [Bacteroidia bacterium]MDW8015898.1 5'/3'-nucleotidase SurE [Bacteroidia bacterium]